MRARADEVHGQGIGDGAHLGELGPQVVDGGTHRVVDARDKLDRVQQQLAGDLGVWLAVDLAEAVEHGPGDIDQVSRVAVDYGEFPLDSKC